MSYKRANLPAAVFVLLLVGVTTVVENRQLDRILLDRVYFI